MGIEYIRASHVGLTYDEKPEYNNIKIGIRTAVTKAQRKALSCYLKSYYD